MHFFLNGRKLCQFGRKLCQFGRKLCQFGRKLCKFGWKVLNFVRNTQFCWLEIVPVWLDFIKKLVEYLNMVFKDIVKALLH